jgi:hypothetical protein
VEGSVPVLDQAGRKRRRSLGNTPRKAPPRVTASPTASTIDAGRKPVREKNASNGILRY